jgi:hygromycin-B 7''-O-kinase
MIVREYYQPDAPDPVLSDAVVLELAHRHLPAIRAVTGIDETGGEARVYFLDQDWVFKVQRPQQLRSWTSLEKEVRFLQQLALDDPGLPVPRVEGYGREAAVEYTLMTRVGGDAAVRTPIPAGARHATLQELGRVIRRIHAIQQAPLRQSGLFPEEYTAQDLRDGVEEDIREYAERFEARGIGWPFPFSVPELIARAQDRVPAKSPAVALHTNPGPTHTFVDPASGAFVGLIDFGDAYIGHPAHDLGRWPDPADRAAILEGYREAGEPDPGFFTFWPVATVLADLLVMARNEARRAAARDDLIATVRDWDAR